MRVGLLAALLLTGCGRWYFDPVQDSGADGSALDGPDGPACTHTFCDNFDRGTPLTSGWDGSSLAGDPIHDILGGQYRIVVNDVSDRGMVNKLFPAVATKVTVGFSIRYSNATPSQPPDQEIDLVRVTWQNLPVGTCTSYGMYLVRDGTGPFNLQETYQGCGSNVNTAIESLDNQPATKVVMTISFGPPTRIKVEIGSAGSKVEKTAAFDAAPSTLQLSIGADVVRNVVSDWDVRYDDLYVDVE